METKTTSVDLIDVQTLENLVRAALFAAIMGAFAYVAFPNPLSPAPVTLQVLGVLLAGLLLGAKWGTVAMFLYVLAGALGAPVFSMGTAGVGALFSERVGYILSFPIAAFVIGILTHGSLDPGSLSDRHPVRLIVAMSAGILVIYAAGVLGLMLVLSLGVWEAILYGALIFIPGEIAKMAAALGIVQSDRLAAVQDR